MYRPPKNNHNFFIVSLPLDRAQYLQELFYRLKRYFSLVSLVSLVTFACASSGNRPPQILNLQDHQLVTNQNFQLDITAFDQDNDYIEFDFTLSPPPPTPTETSGGVPTLQKVSAYKAIFSWTPGNADIGQYSLTITVQDENQAQSSETITLTVVDSNQNGSAGIRFIKPEGSITILNIDNIEQITK